MCKFTMIFEIIISYQTPPFFFDQTNISSFHQIHLQTIPVLLISMRKQHASLDQQFPSSLYTLGGLGRPSLRNTNTKEDGD